MTEPQESKPWKRHYPINKGFTLVEILVGLVLLSLAIMTMSAALRQAFHWQSRQQGYEQFYIAASSLINEIVSVQVEEHVEERNSGSGSMNGFSYTWSCRPFIAANNFEFSQDDPRNSGNTGYFRVVLQQCSLVIEKEKFHREMKLYRTQYCCPLDVNDAP